MKTRSLTIIALAGLVAALMATTAAAADKPNVVIMLADNMGYGDLGAYGSGGEMRGMPTPRIDQLADEGFRVLVVLTGHAGGGHTEAIGRAADAFAEARPDVGVWAFPAFEPIKDVYPFNHAARGENARERLVHAIHFQQVCRRLGVREGLLLGDGPRQQRILGAIPQFRDNFLVKFLDRQHLRIIDVRNLFNVGKAFLLSLLGKSTVFLE